MAITKTAPATEAAVPTHLQRRNKDIVIYDGHCQFCQAQVARLKRFDGRDRLEYLSLHDPQARELCPNLSHDQMMEQMYVVDTDGRQHGGAAAIRYLTRRLPRLWPAAIFLHIPFTMPIWRWLYRQVATRRYRFNSGTCESGSCRIPR